MTVKRLRLKWVLDKEDLRRKLRHFGGVIHDRDRCAHKHHGHRQTSEYGKLTHFIPSVLLHDDILRDGGDTADCSCDLRLPAAVYLTRGIGEVWRQVEKDIEEQESFYRAARDIVGIYQYIWPSY
jgi:hypothetical protein